jgi:hypothetical protein
MKPAYHDGMRELQDRFDSRRLADRLDEKLARAAFTAASRRTRPWRCFIDFRAPSRMRVNGRASLHFDDPLMPSYAGAQAIVRVRAERIFPNCPRYIHRMELVQASPYVPVAGAAAPAPAWKRNPAFSDVLPRD